MALRPCLTTGLPLSCAIKLKDQLPLDFAAVGRLNNIGNCLSIVFLTCQKAGIETRGFGVRPGTLLWLALKLEAAHLEANLRKRIPGRAR
jgi:hypothetical protein